MKLAKLMMKIRAKYNNDSETARNLGISRQSLFNICDGINTPKAKTIESMARELGMNEELLLIQAEKERNTGHAREVWEKIEKKLASIAASILGFSALPALFNGAHCILCQIGNYLPKTKNSSMLSSTRAITTGNYGLLRAL